MNDKSINGVKRRGKISGRKVFWANTHHVWYPPQKYVRITVDLEELLQESWITALSSLAFTLYLPNAGFYRQDNGQSLVGFHCFISFFFFFFKPLRGEKFMLSRNKQNKNKIGACWFVPPVLLWSQLPPSTNWKVWSACCVTTQQYVFNCGSAA